MNLFELMAVITLDSSKYRSGLDEAQRDTESASGKIGTALKTVGKVVTAALAAAAAAAVGFVKSSIDVGMAFDASMSQVAATLGLSMEEMQDQIGHAETSFGSFEGTLREFAQFMGANTAFSATQAADALNYMALAGYTAQESMNMLPNVLNLAAAGSMDLARASDMVTDTQTAFGISADRTTQMVDEMAKAASTGNTSVEQLGDAFLVVGGLASELNGGMVKLADGTTATTDGVQELEIALTAMANSGVKGSEAGTHMRNMLLKLASPTEDGAEQMAALGVSVFDTEGNMRSLHDIMGDLNTSLSTLTQAKKIQAISDLFNARDLASVEALLAAVEQDWDEIGESILDAQGSAQKMAETQLDNLAGDVTRFKSALEGAQIVVSDKLTPKLRDFVKFGTDGISRLTNAFRKGELSGAMAELGDVLSEGIAQMAGGLPTLLGAGSNLVSSLVVGVTKELPNLAKAGVNAVKTLAQNAAKTVPTLIKTATDAIAEIAATLTNPSTLGQMLDTGVELVLSLGRGLVDAIPRLATAVPQIVGNIVQSLTRADSIQKIITGGVDLLGGLLEAVPRVAVGITAAMPDIIGAILTGLADGAAAIFSAIDGLVTGSTERIKASNEKIAEHVEEVKAFADALENTSPQLVDYTRLLSEQGNTIADLDAKTRNAENAITEILAAALQEQRSIREDDLASIQSYMDELSRLAEEKLQIYRSQQVAELLKLQLESGEITRETATQHIANAQEALDRTNSITEEAYTARLTTIQQKYEAMGEVGSAAYKAELDAAKAAHDAQLAENQDFYSKALGEIEKYANDTIRAEENKWKKLNSGLESWKSITGEAVNEGMLAWKNGVGSINDTKDDYLKILSEMDLNTANGFLNMVAEVVAGGGKISEETKQIAADMLGAFDNLPESLDKAGKDALLGLIYGIESKIPGLENTADMTANEIVDTIKAVLGIASPSKVLKDIGINTIQGLIDGMREKTGSVMSQAKTIVSGLVSTVADFVSQFSTIGSNMAAGLWSGFAAQESGLMSRVRSSMQRIVAAARSSLQIESPSKVFAKIGAYSAEGLGVGWDSEIDNITRGIANDLNFSGLATRAAGSHGVVGGLRSAPVTVNITVNGAEGQSVTELADEIERRLVGSYNAKVAAYG